MHIINAKDHFVGLSKSRSGEGLYFRTGNSISWAQFLSDPGVRSMGFDVSQSLRTRVCADLTDATLA